MDTYLENRFHVQPSDTNNNGTVHGGTVMKWLDEVGAMSAMRVAGGTVVTAQMGPISFECPVPLGGIVLIRSYAYQTGNTSINVWFEAYREHIESGETEHITSAKATYVAIDEDGAPVSVPDIAIESDEEKQLHEQTNKNL